MGGYIADSDQTKTLLGQDQWIWLEEQLRQPAELRLIASSIQVIANQKGMDEWGDFPFERQRLFDLIAKTSANGIVLLTGNVHFAELSRTKDTVYPILELTSSGMTHVNDLYSKAVNDYRVAGPYVDLNFGLVEVDWDAQPSPLITLKAIGADGTTGFTHTVQLHEMKVGKDSSVALTTCKNPRPQMCTMDYRPVCAQLKDRSKKTYSNACNACIDHLVTAYKKGICE